MRAVPSLILAFMVAVSATSFPPVLNGSAVAVSALLDRKLPGLSSRFVLSIDSAACGSTTCFRLSDAPGGRIAVVGSSASELSAGCGWFLRERANMTMDWRRAGGSRFVEPAVWPSIGATQVQVKRVGRWSFAENVCTSSYTLVWHSWAQWEEYLDWAALWGINLLYALQGQEEVQYKVFMQLGLTDLEARNWFNGPGALTWSRGQNGHGNGVAGPLPRSWMREQWRLQREQILPRMRLLAIAGQLPAFQGNVPWALHKHLQKPSNMTKGTGQGNGTGWMDSRDANFGSIADLWMTTLLRDFGTVGHVYQMDGFFAATGWGVDADTAAGVNANTKADASTNADGDRARAVQPLTLEEPQRSKGLIASSKGDSDSEGREQGQGQTVACVFGQEQKRVYIPGEAADDGKTYATVAEAKAACLKDVGCGGALSRNCDSPDKICKSFQTRSGMTPTSNVPQVLPCPAGVEVQNSYVITNAAACGHHFVKPAPAPTPKPAPTPPPRPPSPASPTPAPTPQCPGCPPCVWTEHAKTWAFKDCPVGGCLQFESLADAQAACEVTATCNAVSFLPNATGAGAAGAAAGRYKIFKKNVVQHPPAGSGITATWLMSNNLLCRDFGVDSDTLGRGRAGYAGIARTDPDAIWAWQGYAIGVAGWSLFYQPTPWGLSQLRGFTTAAPKGKFLLIDMSANGIGQWRGFLGKWADTPFIWTSIHTYGGTDSLKGNLSRANRIPFDALNTAAEVEAGSGATGVVGSGITPEGFDQNPVYYEVIQGAPWRKAPIANMTQWVVQRAYRRYGITSVDGDGNGTSRGSDIARAWALLEQSSYSEDLGVGDDTGVGSFPQANINYYKRALPHWSKDLSTPSPGLCKTWAAWGLLIKAAPSIDTGTDTSTGASVDGPFRYDLVNTGREVLAQLSTPLAVNFSRAVGIMPPAMHDGSMGMGMGMGMDPATINRTGSAFVHLLRDLDALVSTESSFLLGTWLRDARAKGVLNGTTQTDCTGTAVDSALKGDCQHFYEWNARVQLTTWYPTAEGEPMPRRDTDYARKHWSPLIKDYYATRAELLLAQALADAAAGKPLDAAAVLKFRGELAYNFTTSSATAQGYALAPAPGYAAVSAAMHAKYAPFFVSC
jgi:hypothetical protein